MSDVERPPVVDRDKRQAILDHAIETFAELGFRRTDVQVIADKAGVGKGTVYRYFGNKEDLFWASTREVLLRLEQHLVPTIEGVDGALAKLRAGSRAYASFFEANPSYLEMFVQERAEFRGSEPASHIEHHDRLIDRFSQIIDAGIGAGELRRVPVRRTLVALAGLLYGSVVHACYTSLRDQRTLTEMAEYAVDIFLEGIRAERTKGRRETEQ
jgi:AcrR family transcriptional regulator